MQVEKLAEAHWNYIKDLLLNHKINKSYTEQIGFHYKTAFIHGYKHGQEDLVNQYKDKYKDKYQGGY